MYVNEDNRITVKAALQVLVDAFVNTCKRGQVCEIHIPTEDTPETKDVSQICPRDRIKNCLQHT